MKKEINKELLDKLKIWWNISYKENDREIFEKCNDYYEELIGDTLEKYRFKKFSKVWKDLRMNDLAYIPEHPLNENGILEYYYTKDDIVRICNDNKVIACFLYLRLKGERVEEGIEELKRMYLEWFLSDIEDVNLYKSEVSINIFRILDDKDKEKVLEVLDINTGERINKEIVDKI